MTLLSIYAALYQAGCGCSSRRLYTSPKASAPTLCGSVVATYSSVRLPGTAWTRVSGRVTMRSYRSISVTKIYVNDVRGTGCCIALYNSMLVSP